MPKKKSALPGLPVQALGEDFAALIASSAGAAAPGKQPPRHERLFTGPDILAALAIATLIGAAYSPIVQGMLSGASDYTAHASFAQRFVEQGTLVSPACLLHLLVAALVRSGLAASYESATLAVVVCSHAAVAAVLYSCARWAVGTHGGRLGRFLPGVIAVIGPFVQPPVSWNTQYSIGYIWAEPYHSPTYALLKPFALAGAAFAVYFLAQSRQPNWKVISLCAVTVAAGTLAKPSFAICALPALVLCAVYQQARKAPFSRIGVLCGWLLPGLATLAWQYLRTYATPDDPSRYADSIIFAPLAVMRVHTNDLAAPYFWSTLLPLCVFAVFGKQAWADGGLRFSLIAFLFGTVYTYTLAEQARLGAGNFLWSSYITLFVLYFFAVVFVLRQLTNQVPTAKTLLRAAPCIVILIWQLTSGFSVHMNYIGRY